MIKVLTNPHSNLTDPGLDINDPLSVSQREIRHDERHDDTRDDVQWTIPPVSAGSPASMPDQSISLEIGVVYNIIPGTETMFQNLSENEDDKVEFSTHGDALGTWAKLNPGSILKTDNEFFLLNRTSFENLRIAVIEPSS